MSGHAQSRDKAIKIAQDACNLDAQKDYHGAYTMYKLAIKHFLFVIKYETNPSLKANLEAKATEYLDRCEQIKKYLDTQANPTEAPAVVAEGGPRNGTDEERKDDPNNGLRGQLESAIIQEKPNVHWDDVAGLANAKQALQEAVILPTRYPELFEGKRKPWKGILLYGPPGTGKSFLAKACATEADAKFFSVSSSDLVSKYMGESERLVRCLFELARENQPSIIFIDEIDSLCGSRSDGENDATRRIKTEFLVQMQGVGKDDDGVLVLGATNIPWGLDAAIRRRFERRIYIPLPEAQARERMVQIHLGSTPHNLQHADFQALGQQTEGFSGSDIGTLVKSALMEPIRKCQSAQVFRVIDDNGKQLYSPTQPGDPAGVPMTLMQVPPNCLKAPDVTGADFFHILSSTRPSVSQEDLVKQEEFTREFGMEG